MVNILHVQTTTPEDADTVGDAVAAAWGLDEGLCLLQSTSVTLDGVDVTPLDGVSPTVSVAFGGAENQAGQHSAFPMPAGDAMVISLKSAARGRSKNGRLFLGGLCSNQMPNDQQSWSSTTVSTATAAWAAMVAKLDDDISGSQFVVASYLLVEAFPIITASPKTAVASQRRRDH
jgi:hypothetical protein